MHHPGATFSTWIGGRGVLGRNKLIGHRILHTY
jgi:hypothetical protein